MSKEGDDFVCSGRDSNSQEVITDLERRVGEISSDLVKYETQREQLNAQLQRGNEHLQADDVIATQQKMREELEFVEAQIAGLNEELRPLKGWTQTRTCTVQSKHTVCSVLKRFPAVSQRVCIN